MEGDECVGKCRQHEWIEEEAYTVEKCKEECLYCESVMNRKRIDGTDDILETGKSNGNTEENSKPSESESDESRGAGDVPDPRSLYRGWIGCDDSGR